MKSALLYMFAWLSVLSILSAFQFLEIQTGRQAARSDSRAAWRAVICSVESASMRNPKTSTADKAAAIKFWTELLVDKIHTRPCE